MMEQHLLHLRRHEADMSYELLAPQPHIRGQTPWLGRQHKRASRPIMCVVDIVMVPSGKGREMTGLLLSVLRPRPTGKKKRSHSASSTKRIRSDICRSTIAPNSPSEHPTRVLGQQSKLFQAPDHRKVPRIRPSQWQCPGTFIPSPSAGRKTGWIMQCEDCPE